MKRTRSLFFSLTLAVILCVPLIGCSSAEDVATEEVATEEPSEEFLTPEPVTVPPVTEYAAAARQHIVALTNIGARWSGTQEEAQAGEYITSAFEQMGYAPETQSFSATGEDGEIVDSANIIAIKDGDSSQVIVVGAHYDSSDESVGADDNASGVTVLLETANLVKNESTPYTVYFVAFGAEEAGLLGSAAFVNSLDDTSNIALFINMDSIVAGDIAYIYSPEEQPKARDWLLDWASFNDYSLQTIKNVNLSQDGAETADYAAFQEASIPWIYFEATNWTLGERDGYTQVDPQYGDNGAIIHTQYDNLAYIDETFPGRVDHHLDLYVSALNALLTEYK
jgi:hypothetical protein